MTDVKFQTVNRKRYPDNPAGWIAEAEAAWPPVERAVAEAIRDIATDSREAVDQVAGEARRLLAALQRDHAVFNQAAIMLVDQLKAHTSDDASIDEVEVIKSWLGALVKLPDDWPTYSGRRPAEHNEKARYLWNNAFKPRGYGLEAALPHIAKHIEIDGASQEQLNRRVKALRESLKS